MGNFVTGLSPLLNQPSRTTLSPSRVPSFGSGMAYSLKSSLEAIWEGRWCGIVLTGAATIACAFLFYLVPPPGVSVDVMGVTAAIMAARTKATGAEKAAWMLIISALLVIEVAAIKKERFFNEQTEKLRTEEERQHFAAIGTGIEQTIGQGQQQFNATLTTEKNNLARTLGGLKETVKRSHWRRWLLLRHPHSAWLCWEHCYVLDGYPARQVSLDERQYFGH